MFNFLKLGIVCDDTAKLEEAVCKKCFLVDVRSNEEFKSGSVDGAVNIPMNEVPNRLKEFKNKKNIILFCRSGGRSNQVKDLLIRNGIEDVLNAGSPKHLRDIMSKVK